MEIRDHRASDMDALCAIWNEVVREGTAFPQLEELGTQSGPAFFQAQTRVRVAVDEADVPQGLYILHPNNVGRVGHIANASYAVAPAMRGRGVGEALVRDSLRAAHEEGFRIMQFNAVVAGNAAALHLYRRLGFVDLGVIPGGFRMDTAEGGARYEDIHVMYFDLMTQQFA